MISIVTPEYQFLRFSDQHLDDPNWHEYTLPGTSIGFTIPVAADDDIAFQFKVITTTEEEADAVCAFPIDALYLMAYAGTSLGPTVTAAELLAIPTSGTTAGALNAERYRLSDTEVLFYFPKITLGELICGQCFQLGLIFDGYDVNIAAISNALNYVCDADYTTVIDYTSAQDEAGFVYCVSPSIKSRVRLPLYLTRPTFPEEETEHRLSSGAITITKAVVRKVYEVVSEVLPGWALESLRAVWLHDDVVTGTSETVPQTLPYTGEIVKEGGYEVEYVEFLNYPLGKPKFKVSASPFLLKKNNCGECVDYSDLLFVPGAILQPVTSNTTYVIDLNTYIEADCCSPLSTEIDYFQTNKIDPESVLPSISIVDNVLTFKTRSTFLMGTPPPLIRIKVTCGGIVKYIAIED